MSEGQFQSIERKAAQGMDSVTDYYRANAAHNRLVKALSRKIVAKWRDSDFEAMAATRAVRESAVARLTLEQVYQHVEGCSEESAKQRALKERARRRQAELQALAVKAENAKRSEPPEAATPIISQAFIALACVRGVA